MSSNKCQYILCIYLSSELLVMFPPRSITEMLSNLSDDRVIVIMKDISLGGDTRYNIFNICGAGTIITY